MWFPCECQGAVKDSCFQRDRAWDPSAVPWPAEQKLVTGLIPPLPRNGAALAQAWAPPWEQDGHNWSLALLWRCWDSKWWLWEIEIGSWTLDRIESAPGCWAVVRFGGALRTWQWDLNPLIATAFIKTGMQLMEIWTLLVPLSGVTFPGYSPSVVISDLCHPSTQSFPVFLIQVETLSWLSFWTQYSKWDITH